MLAFLLGGVLALYVVFLSWSAIMSEPAAVTCNTRPRQTGQADWITIVSFLLAFSVIILSTFSTGFQVILCSPMQFSKVRMANRRKTCPTDTDSFTLYLQWSHVLCHALCWVESSPNSPQVEY